MPDHRPIQLMTARGRGGRIVLSLGIVGLLLVAGCKPREPNPIELNKQLMTATTSEIPGARGSVFAGLSGDVGNGPPGGYCVTDAGYCRLSAPAPSGRNCLCEAGGQSFGGKTGAAPETYQPK